MESAPRTDEQAMLWNGAAGHAWVDAQDLLDRMLAPFEHLLRDVVAAAGARRVLDVGCGTGGVTRALMRVLGADGHCTGVDLSAPMIAAAQALAAREGSAARFVCADAQRHAFEPAQFDMLVSRFGVMFFDDPVRAFANLRHAAADGAALHCIAWRSAAENPFMTTAERAAAPLLPELPPRRHDAPGQFAFADRGHVHRVLDAAGWGAIDIAPIDVACVLPERELAGYFSRLGPVGLALRQVDEATRARVIEAVRAAFEPYVHGDEVHCMAACWRIVARAG